MTKITSAIAAAFIASVSFAGAALADEGQYYHGADKTQNVETFKGSQGGISYGYTGSISRAANGGQNVDGQALNRGDYYDGANRPN
jgi:hypothetical protein